MRFHGRDQQTEPSEALDFSDLRAGDSEVTGFNKNGGEVRYFPNTFTFVTKKGNTVSLEPGQLLTLPSREAGQYVGLSAVTGREEKEPVIMVGDAFRVLPRSIFEDENVKIKKRTSKK